MISTISNDYLKIHLKKKEKKPVGHQMRNQNGI